MQSSEQQADLPSTQPRSPHSVEHVDGNVVFTSSTLTCPETYWNYKQIIVKATNIKHSLLVAEGIGIW